MNIPDKARRIMELLLAEGARDALIVGGCVRDAILGVESKDVDIEVYGVDMDFIHGILELNDFRVDAVGKSFGVLKIDNEIDVSVPRREKKTGDGHRGFDVEPDPDMSIEDAAARRDFTINSMAMNRNGEIIDPFNGRKHLDERLLRHTSEAFVEDPLRPLRAMQFSARFGMDLDPETMELCRKMANQKGSLPKERIWEEWKKWALKGKHPCYGLHTLEIMGWADPEIQALVDVPQDPEWHPEGCVFLHTGYVVDEAARIAERDGLNEHDRLVLIFAALAHDFGKPATTEMKDGRWRAHRHTNEGAAPTEAFLQRIGAPLDVIAEVKPLVVEHLVHAGNEPTPKAVRRLANRLAPATIESLGRLIEADHSGRPPLPKGNPFQSWVDKAHELNIFSEKPQPILMGRHLLDIGIKPGRAMGVMLNRAFESQLNGDFENLDAAIQWAHDHREWLAEHMG